MHHIARIVPHPKDCGCPRTCDSKEVSDRLTDFHMVPILTSCNCQLRDSTCHCFCCTCMSSALHRIIVSCTCHCCPSRIDRPTLLDIDHRWISNKSVPLCHPLLHFFHPKVRSISITSLTPLCSSLSPLSHPSSLWSLFH